MKVKKQKKASNDWFAPDEEWKPYSRGATLKSSPSSPEQDSESQFTPPDIEDEVDYVKINTCPVCRKWFSRNAALFCHIKQNHRYVLSKPHENNYDELEKQIREWQKRMKDQGSSRPTTSGNGKDNKDGSSSSSPRMNEYDSNDDVIEIEDFPLVGGSASTGNASEKSQSIHSEMSLFNNCEFLDPDESFSVVRSGPRKKAKKSLPQSKLQSKSVAKKPVSRTVTKKPVNRTVTKKPVNRTVTKKPVSRTKVKRANTTRRKRVTRPKKKAVVRKTAAALRKNDKRNTNDCELTPKVTTVRKTFRTETKPVNSIIVTSKVVNRTPTFESFDFSVDNSPKHEKTHKCSICGSWFSNPILVTYHHMRNHMTNDLQQCSKCGRVFYDSDMYKFHLECHN